MTQEQHLVICPKDYNNNADKYGFSISRCV